MSTAAKLGTRNTQRGEILRLLIEAKGGWVPLPEIMACAAQYNSRVLELRRLGFTIENKTERVNGTRHSWFRLIASPAHASVTALPHETPHKVDPGPGVDPGAGVDWFEHTTGKSRPAGPVPDLGPLFETVTR